MNMISQSNTSHRFILKALKTEKLFKCFNFSGDKWQIFLNKMSLNSLVLSQFKKVNKIPYE